MKLIKILGVALVAASSFTALTATSASALLAPGPSFLLESAPLQTGEQARLEAASLGTFELKPTLSSPAILCEHLSAPTLLLGGAPGKSDTEIAFSGCTADNTSGTTNYPLCDVHNAGRTGNLILVKAEDELVYTGSKEEAKKEEGPLGDLFTPEGGGTTFVTLEAEELPGGTGCPKGLPSTEAVTGNVVGEVEPVNTMSEEGMLTFPKTAIKKAYRWKGKGAAPEELTTGLKLPTGGATESGLADLKLENGETWGVLTAPGPLFLLESAPLQTGEQARLEASSLGTFELKPTLSSPAILCEHLSAPTLLLGGAPGKSDTEIAFSGCTVDNTSGTTNYPLCDVHNAGGSGNLILVKAEDELVYTGSKTEAEKEEGALGDLFTPESGGTTFVTLQAEALPGGTGCPTGTPAEEAVTGNVVGEVEPVNTMSEEGMLTFPKTAVKKAYRWKGKGSIEELTTGLKLPTGGATESGLADLKLENGETWGVLTGLGA